MELLISAGLAAFIAGAVSIISLLLQRRWTVKDRKENGSEAIMTRLTEIETKLDSHIEEDRMAKAKTSRTRILRFNDEVLNNVKHTQEHWGEILEDIDTYEHYCTAHPDFPNNKAVLAIQNLKKTYTQCMQKNNFL